MTRRVFKVKQCKRSQSFLWYPDRLTEKQKGKVISAKKRGNVQKSSAFKTELQKKKLLTSFYGNLPRKTMKILTARVAQQSAKRTVDLVSLLEMRLDTCLFRMNFVCTFSASRQLIRHGFIQVNGKTCTVSSRELQAGDLIQVKKPFPSHWQEITLEKLEAKKLLRHNAQHLEINHKLGSAIVLFPPQQIYYPLSPFMI